MGLTVITCQLSHVIMSVPAGCVCPPVPHRPGCQEVIPLLQQRNLDPSTSALRAHLPRGAVPMTLIARPPALQGVLWPALASPSRLLPADGSLWMRWTWRGNMSDSATKQMRWEQTCDSRILSHILMVRNMKEQLLKHWCFIDLSTCSCRIRIWGTGRWGAR